MQKKPAATRPELDAMTKKELVALARQHAIPGYSKLTKAKLIAVLGHAASAHSKPSPEVVAVVRAADASDNPTEPAVEPTHSRTTKVKRTTRRRNLPVEPYPDVEAPAAHDQALELPQPASVFKPINAEVLAEAAKPEGQKFESAEPEELPKELPGDAELPATYGRDYIFLIARDHEWLYAYWELSAEFKQQLVPFAARDCLMLTLYDLAKSGKQLIEQFPITLKTADWFFNVVGNGRIYEAEIGVKVGNRYVRALASHPATTPRTSAVITESVQFLTVPLKIPLRSVMNALAPYHDDPQMVTKKLQELQTGGITLPFNEQPEVELKPAIQVRVMDSLQQPSRPQERSGIWHGSSADLQKPSQSPTD